MHRSDSLLAGALHLEAFEDVKAFELAQDGLDAHRGLDVAAFANVVDFVSLVDEQGDAAGRVAWRDGDRVVALRVAGGPQAELPVGDRCDDRLDVFRRADALVLAFEDDAHDGPQAPRSGKVVATETIEHEKGRLVVALPQRSLVGGPHQGPRTPAFVEAQARAVGGEVGRFAAELGIVWQAFEVQAFGADQRSFFTDSLVEGCTDAAAAARFGGDPVEVAEAVVRDVQQRGASDQAIVAAFGHQHDGAVAGVQGIAHALAQSSQLVRIGAGKTAGEQVADALDRGRVARKSVVGQFADAEHQRTQSAGRRGRRRSASSAMRETSSS